MNTLKDIFDYYNTEKNGKIHCSSFKLIINLIDMPIIDCMQIYYNYNDLIDYIKKYGKIQKPISKFRAKHIIKNNYKENIQFIINEADKNLIN